MSGTSKELNTRVKGRILVISDRVLAGERDNTAGELALRMLKDAGVDLNDDDVVVIAEDEAAIRTNLGEALENGYRLVFTIGGTGISPRNATPEVTREFLVAELPGVATQITMEGLKNSDKAGLSRAVVGVTRRALICNAPSSTGGVKDTLAVITRLLRPIFMQLDEE